MGHVSFAEAARRMASEGYGESGVTPDTAAGRLAAGGVQVGDAALLELVRVVNVVVGALAADAMPGRHGDLYPGVNRGPDGEDGVYPGVSVGDSLYVCHAPDLPVERAVVVQTDAAGHCRVFWPTDKKKMTVYDLPGWAEPGLHRTPGAAVAEACREYLDVWAGEEAACQSYLDRYARGEDVSDCYEGVFRPRDADGGE